MFRRSLMQCSTNVSQVAVITLAMSLGLGYVPAAVAQPNYIQFVRHYNKAVAAYYGGKWDVAREQYILAVAVDPQDTQSYVGLINTYRHTEDWNQVVSTSKLLLTRMPSARDQIALCLGTALFHLKKYEEARVYLDRAAALIDSTTLPFKPQLLPDGLIHLSK